MITRLKQTIEDKYPGTQVIYGDSVVVDTPLLIRYNDGSIDVTTIEQLANFSDNSNEKSYAVPMDGIQIWTEKGWTLMKTVMRHKTNKAIYRVATRSGVVDVTEDHSLLNSKSEPITPGNVTVGTELLHAFPKEWPFSMTGFDDILWMSEVAEIHGGFVALKDSRVPYYIFSAPFKIREAFLKSYCECSDSNDNVLNVQGHLKAMGLFYVSKSLGYNVSIETCCDDSNMCKLYLTKKHHNESS